MIKYFSLKQEKKAEADAAAAAGTDGSARPAKKTKAAQIRVQKGTPLRPPPTASCACTAAMASPSTSSFCIASFPVVSFPVASFPDLSCRFRRLLRHFGAEPTEEHQDRLPRSGRPAQL